MDGKTLKGIEVTLRKEDDKRFNQATKIINELTAEQARFALLLVNQRKRGYLAMPDIQENFIADLDRAKKAR
jgi:hypothetical protein